MLIRYFSHNNCHLLHYYNHHCCGTSMIVTIMNMIMISISILIKIMIIIDNLLQDCVAQKELPWPIPKRKNDDVTWVVTNQTGNTNSWIGHMTHIMR